MKSILLQFKHQSQNIDPTRYVVTFDGGDLIEVHYPKCPWDKQTLRKHDGGWINQNRVEFVEIKPDRRPKPFAVRYEGMDGTSTKKFATLKDAAQYVWDRWEGTDYQNGPAAFHNDYGMFYLTGFVLADIFTFTFVDDWPQATRKEL